MAIYFEGTSTKNKYEVGKDYVGSGGKIMTANKDGSFTNKETGQVSKGSAQNPDVNWYASGSDAAAFWAERKADPVGDAAHSGGSGGGDAPANALIHSGGAPVSAVKVPGPASLGLGGAYLKSVMWSGKDEPPQDNLFWGIHIKANENTTNAELAEARYGDLVSAVWGVGVLGADAAKTAGLWWGGGGSKQTEAAAIKTGQNIWGGLNWLLDEREKYIANDEVRKAHLGDIEDAWDARMEYQQENALQGGDWTAIQSVLDENEKIAAGKAANFNVYSNVPGIGEALQSVWKGW